TQNDYDVVITDIKMPEITGNQILQHVKLKNGNAFPVVGISGTPWLLEQSNFDAVLSKPCTIKELKKAMDQVLNKNYI
ncbi:MAG: response regulator, partial [Desulfobacteraceae bacterium]|nr:response regulator [Desulfobacteraceae bacterium]